MNAFFPLFAPSRTKWLRFLCTLLLVVASPFYSRAAVTVTQVVVSNINTSGFTAAWLVSEASTPGVDLFQDAEGTLPLAQPARVSITPLGLGNVEAGSTVESRAARRSLSGLVSSRQLALVRVAGLPPGATVYFRPRSFAANGADVGAAVVPLRAVDLATSISFVADAEFLAVDYSAFSARGMLAILEGPLGVVPLSAVVGDGPEPDTAYFNLADLVSSALRTNLGSNAPVQFSIRLLGLESPGDSFTHTVVFQPGLVVAGYGSAAPDSGQLGSFLVDTVATQNAGLGFVITLRARSTSGQPLATYSGTAVLSSSGALALGAGETPAFTGGVLTGHVVRIDRPGVYTLMASAAGSTGASAPFTVNDNFGAWRNTYFNAIERANPGVSGLMADPGQAGIPNLLRYAFSTGVSSPNRALLPVVGTEAVGLDKFLTISFRRLVYAADVSYVVEASGDLSGWTTLQTVVPGLPELVVIRDTVAMSPGVRRFLRVRVVSAPTYASYLNLQASDAVRNSPSLYSDASDPGNVGMPNMVRYAFGLNYSNAAGGGLPVATTVRVSDELYLAVSFVRLSTGGGVRYLVQTSSTLGGSWATIQTVLPGEPAQMTVRDVAPLSATAPRFMRVLVDKVPN